MPLILSTEFENQNSRRAYPFEDNATMADTSWVALPLDLLLDAHICPIWTGGMEEPYTRYESGMRDSVHDVVGTSAEFGVYLSKIDRAASLMYISDASTGDVVGTASYAGATAGDYIEVREPGVYARHVGMLYLGAGVLDIVAGPTVSEFVPSATSFCASCISYVCTAGVTDLVIPSGDRFHDNVVLMGENGVVVRTWKEAGRHYLRFDVIGVPNSSPEDCGVPRPLCKIIVTRTSDSVFVPSRYDNSVLAITADGISLDDICQSSVPGPMSAGGRVRWPTSDDPCDPAPAVPPAVPITTAPLEFDLCESGLQVFSIVAPSTIDYRNPVAIGGVRKTELPVNPPVGRMTVDEVSDAMHDSLISGHPGGSVTISLGTGAVHD